MPSDPVQLQILLKDAGTMGQAPAGYAPSPISGQAGQAPPATGGQAGTASEPSMFGKWFGKAFSAISGQPQKQPGSAKAAKAATPSVVRALIVSPLPLPVQVVGQATPGHAATQPNTVSWTPSTPPPSVQSLSAGKAIAPMGGAATGEASAALGGSAEAEGVTALGAAAGVAGVALGTAAAVIKVAFDGAAAVVQSFAKNMQGVASLNPAALTNVMGDLVSQIPLVGKALGGIVQAGSAFVAGLEGSASRLAPYSGDISQAKAEAGVRQVQGDIGRAQRLGPALADFTTAKSEFEQTAQDTLAKIIEPFIPIATGFFQFVTPIIKEIGDGVKFVIDLINNIIGGINGIITELNKISFLGYQLAIPALNKIVRNTDPEKPKDIGIIEFLKIKPLRQSLEFERDRLIRMRDEIGGRAAVPPLFGVP
jgi:hypothetical protein